MGVNESIWSSTCRLSKCERVTLDMNEIIVDDESLMRY